MVLGYSGWQEYALSDGTGPTRLDPQAKHPSQYLGVLGMPGFTGYMGLVDIGKPQAGETVVVAAASGAVGSVVGQVASILGCQVIGIAGGAAKCRFVTAELGFDACIDHHGAGLPARLATARTGQDRTAARGATPAPAAYAGVHRLRGLRWPSGGVRCGNEPMARGGHVDGSEHHPVDTEYFARIASALNHVGGTLLAGPGEARFELGRYLGQSRPDLASHVHELDTPAHPGDARARRARSRLLSSLRLVSDT
jgi:hypothetical protein